MLSNYIKLAFRNISKHKMFSLINILGFSLALIPVLLSILYIRYELSYDRYNKNYDRIYRIVQEYKFNDKLIGTPIVPNPLAYTMEDDLPEVEAATRITKSNGSLSFKDKKIFDLKGLYADPNIFKIFTFDFLKGNPNNPLQDPYSIVISESTAKKYFGDVDPVGKTLTLREVYDLSITGVYNDIPQNSHFSADYIVSSYLIASSGIFNGISNPNAWGTGMFSTYFLLRENLNSDELLKKFPEFLKKYSNNDFFNNSNMYFQPLGDIHLYSHLKTEFNKNGNINTIYLYSGVALIILLMACINYINLSTSRLFQRKKEIGIRKVIGAQKKQLVRQFIVESVIITLCSFLITVIITELLLPYFNSFVDRDIDFSLFGNVSFFLFLFFIVGIIGLLSGLFPAITFSSYRPASFFGGQNIIIRKSRLSNILIVVQFVFSTVFIFCSIILSEQLNFVLNKDLGYERNNIVTIGLYNRVSNDQIDALINQLLQDPGIVSVSASAGLPNRMFGGGPIELPNKLKNGNFYIDFNNIDYNFIDLFGLKTIIGREFSKNFSTDKEDAIILNETAARDLGWVNPIGKVIIHSSPYGKSVRHVIGVVKDFNINSLYDKINPCYLVIDHNMPVYNISIKIKSNILSPTTFAYLKKQMTTFQPGVPFEPKYFSDIINAQYKSEFNLQKIFLMFSFFTIFIACLGLYGLISFITELRTKEIGIRKTLGASSFQIVWLLIMDIIGPVFISGILAFPFSYYLMNKWLSDFAYRTEINYGYLLVAVFIICTVSISTMLSQALKAANRNLADVLKYE